MRSLASLATSSLLASVASAQVVQWDIEKRDNSVPKLTRRADGTVVEVITNEKTRGGYFASCSVGTPAQKITLQLDTGSSDIWVPASTASVCEPQGQGCTFGSFDVSASSSAVLVNREFQISYVDGSSSTGDYINETFAIGDVKLTNMQMGLGLQTDIAYGLVGVGYDLNEASQELYANLPIMMVNEGFINSIAYSLWLNDLGASTGNILFGGIDTDKYTGDLISVDVQPAAQDEFTSFTVLLTSVEGHSSSGEDALSSSSFPIPVVLDSGTTFSYLPDDLALQVWTEVGAEYMVVSNDGTGAPLVPCALANNNGYVAFGFGGTGGPVIKVGMDELVSPIFTSDVKFTSGTYKGESICQFGIQNLTVTNSEGTPHFLLGDTFLRSAYVVYDLENNQIGLANTDFNATSSNVVPFPSAGAAIPSASAAPSQTAVNSGPTGSPAYNARAGFTDLSSTGSSSGSSGSGSSGNSSGGDDNAGSLAPALDFTQLIVMGASMGLMMFGGGMFLLF